MQVREGACDGQLTDAPSDYYVEFKNANVNNPQMLATLNHPAGAATTVGGYWTDTNRSNVLNAPDLASSREVPPYSNGILTWEIPILYKHTGDPDFIQFDTVTQQFEIFADGTFCVRKDKIPFKCKGLNDGTSNY